MQVTANCHSTLHLPIAGSAADWAAAAVAPSLQRMVLWHGVAGAAGQSSQRYDSCQHLPAVQAAEAQHQAQQAVGHVSRCGTSLRYKGEGSTREKQVSWQHAPSLHSVLRDLPYPYLMFQGMPQSLTVPLCPPPDTPQHPSSTEPPVKPESPRFDRQRPDR